MDPLSTWSQSITGAGEQSSLSWSHSLVLLSKSGQWDKRGSQVRGMWGRTSLLLKRDAEIRHCCFSWLWRLVCGHAMPGAIATILQPRKNCGHAEGMAQKRRGKELRYLRLTWGHISVKLTHPGATLLWDWPSMWGRSPAWMVYYLQHEIPIAWSDLCAFPIVNVSSLISTTKLAFPNVSESQEALWPKPTSVISRPVSQGPQGAIEELPSNEHWQGGGHRNGWCQGSSW